jgi:RecJ-like exonuclease
METAILIHGDTDGVCSGAIALNKYPDASVWFTHPVGLLADIRRIKAERIILCDLAISEKEKDELFLEFLNISSKAELIYIDHHPLPLDTIAGDIPATQVVRDLTKSSSELTYTHLGNEAMHIVAVFGAISDYYTDTTDFVVKTMDVYDKRTLYLESGFLSQALSAQGKRDYAFKRKIVSSLSMGVMPSSRPDIVRKAVEGTRKEWETVEFVKKKIEEVDGLAIVRDIPKGISPTKAAKFALGISGLPVAISTKIKKRDHVDITARKLSTFSLDLNLTFRTITTRFEGSGGGHPTAAGGRIPQKNLGEFLKAFSKEVEAIP